MHAIEDPTPLRRPRAPVPSAPRCRAVPTGPPWVVLALLVAVGLAAVGAGGWLRLVLAVAAASAGAVALAVSASDLVAPG